MEMYALSFSVSSLMLKNPDYLCYMCTSTLAAVFVFFFCPETKNRGLEDIDEFFLRSKSPFDTVKVARELPWDAGLSSVIETKLEDAQHEHEEAAHQRRKSKA
jgi:hypothetical protein